MITLNITKKHSSSSNRTLYLLVFFQLFTISIPQTCNQIENYCNNKGSCSYNGNCLCDTYYYGEHCEFTQLERPKIVETGISNEALAGIILGWLFGIPILLAAGLLIILRKRFVLVSAERPHPPNNIEVQQIREELHPIREESQSNQDSNPQRVNNISQPAGVPGSLARVFTIPTVDSNQRENNAQLQMRESHQQEIDESDKHMEERNADEHNINHFPTNRQGMAGRLEDLNIDNEEEGRN